MHYVHKLSTFINIFPSNKMLEGQDGGIGNLFIDKTNGMNLMLKLMTYRVFIKYCVFSKDFRIFWTLAFLCFPLVSVFVHTAGR